MTKNSFLLIILILLFQDQNSSLFFLAQPNKDFEQNGSLYNNIYYIMPNYNLLSLHHCSRILH